MVKCKKRDKRKMGKYKENIYDNPELLANHQ